MSGAITRKAFFSSSFFYDSGKKSAIFSYISSSAVRCEKEKERRGSI